MSVVAYATGLALGLSLAGPPGPVNALIAREASRRGAWAGIRAGVAAPILDTTYLALVTLGLPRVVDLNALRVPLSAVGAVLMLYLAWMIARPPGERKEIPSIGAVILVTLTNPFQYAWWLSAGAAFATAQGLWGILGFLCAIFGWVGLFSVLVARGASRWSWFEPAITLLAADLLCVFAIQLAGAGMAWL